MAVQLTWSEPVIYGGVHAVDWRLFRDAQLLKRKRSDEKLVGRPTWVASHIGGGSFTPGAPIESN